MVNRDKKKIWSKKHVESNGEEGFKEEKTRSFVDVYEVINTSGDVDTVECYEVEYTPMIGDSGDTLERFGPNSKHMAIGYADGFIRGLHWI